MKRICFAILVTMFVICGKSEIKADTVSQNDAHIEMMAKCVEAEAGNQGLMGKRFVVDVILNRVDSEIFPNDIKSVISQKGQFAVYSNGRMNRTQPSEETYEAIKMELEHRTDDQILFFASGNYNKCSTPAYKHGDHYFGYLKKEVSE